MRVLLRDAPVDEWLATDDGKIIRRGEVVAERVMCYRLNGTVEFRPLDELVTVHDLPLDGT